MPRLGEVGERQGERHNVGERCGETKRVPTTVVAVGARFWLIDILKGHSRLSGEWP